MDEVTLGMVSSLQQYFMQRTVPLIARQGDHYSSVGTGTLITSAGRHFILTTQHGIEDEDLSTLACPETPQGGALRSFGRMEVYKPGAKNVDFALIEIFEPWILRQPPEGWQFVPDSNIGHVSGSDGFMIVGYPKPRMMPSGRDIDGPPVMVLTRLLHRKPSSAKKPVVDGIDVFFECNRRATDLLGRPEEMIALEGISGTAVWQYTDVKSGVWSPTACLQIVAVESACKIDEYIRSVSWVCVLKLLAHVTGRSVTVRQVRSPIGRPRRQCSTLRGLGLDRIGREATLPNTPEVQGMIDKVSHLVERVDRVVFRQGRRGRSTRRPRLGRQ